MLFWSVFNTIRHDTESDVGRFMSEFMYCKKIIGELRFCKTDLKVSIEKSTFRLGYIISVTGKYSVICYCFIFII